ncbi:DUF1003 domain-containing protein [Nocardia sp. R6R-6]|uniref:DUF1003 domain-containing protein n=1 Tax=Nocardia sp. R6R-6 TaxID=3459303 RepID=UPI00403E200C
MVLHEPRWHEHPHVRSGSELSFGEQAADVLKRVFGSWPFLGVLNLLIVVWAVLNWSGIVHFDPYPFILLNLLLSWLAAQQGGALQIAANRGDRIASELALSTYRTGEEILKINQAQMEILQEMRRLRGTVERETADEAR